jgi:hypothetical protein
MERIVITTGVIEEKAVAEWLWVTVVLEAKKKP